MNIEQVSEVVRGCGYRKPDSFYLRGSLERSCTSLPFELTICKCCGEGIRQTRGWRKVNLFSLLNQGCDDAECVLNKDNLSPDDIDFLLWVGKAHYSVESFVVESFRMGVSKKIGKTKTGNPSLPKDFILGQSRVLLAQPEAYAQYKGMQKEMVAGVFAVFVPARLEYVVDPDKLDQIEYQQRLEKLEDQGAKLIELGNPISSHPMSSIYESSTGNKIISVPPTETLMNILWEGQNDI